MTALAANRNTPELDIFPGGLSPFEYGVKASAKLYSGAAAGVDTSGRMVPMSADTSLVALGRVDRLADNTGGADNAITAKAKPGIYRWTNGDAMTASSRGAVCYFGDDQTVYSTDGGATRPKAGVVVDVDSSGVWVATGFNFISNPAATPLGTLQKKTVTIGQADLTDAVNGQAQALNIGTALPANAMVVAALLTLTTQFTGGGAASVTLDVGWSGGTQKVINAFDAFGSTAAGAEYSQGATPAHHPVTASAKQLIATFTPDGGASLLNLTAGAVTIDVFYFVAF